MYVYMCIYIYIHYIYIYIYIYTHTYICIYRCIDTYTQGPGLRGGLLQILSDRIGVPGTEALHKHYY